MLKKTLLFLIILIYPNIGFAQNVPLQKWNYELERGPARWSRLDPAYGLCGRGKQQSPINIEMDDVSAPNEDPTLEFNTIPFLPIIYNTGNYIQALGGEGNYLTWNGERYDLKSTDLHSPAEHGVKGVFVDAEVQMMYKNKDNYVGVSLLLKKGRLCFDLQPIFRNIPLEPKDKVDVKSTKLNLKKIIERENKFYFYDGSLTHPPCHENVKWIIFAHPIEVTLEQLEKLRHAYTLNARPDQPLNGRRVYVYPN